MKSFLKFIFIFSVILLLSVVLTPILFKFLPFKFERIFNRLVMIFSLTAIVLFVRVKTSDWKNYGMIPEKGWLTDLAKGFFTGVFILVLLTIFRTMIGFSSVSSSGLNPGEVLLKVIQFTFTGLLIGVIEEFFFRGYIDKQMRERFHFPLWLAIAGTSLFYAALHFVSKEKIWISSNPGIQDSLKLLGAPFLSFNQFHVFWPAFVGLFLFGVILHVLRMRSRSLYPGIGLHAGCVFFVKSDGMFVDLIKPSSLVMGSKMFYDGVIGWFSIFIIGAILYFWVASKTKEKI